MKLTVNEPSSDIIMVLASPIQFAAIYPKSVVDSASDEGVKEYIGTGPYKVAEWKQDQYVKLEKMRIISRLKGNPVVLQEQKMHRLIQSHLIL